MRTLVRAVRASERVFEVVTPSEARFLVEAGAYDRPGDAAGPAPMELLLSALVTCAGSTIDSVLAKMRIPVTALNVVADAERAERVPRVYTHISLEFHLASEAPADRLRHAIEVTERTCSASVMLARSAEISPRLVHVRFVEPEITRPLRRQILRPHQNLDDLVSPGETDPGAVWLAAHDGEEVVATMGLIPESPPDGTTAARPYRLRGMATSEPMRGRGLGAVVLGAGLERLRSQGADLVWCSARKPAAGFYRAAGFTETSAEYQVEHIGPHVRMAMPL
jgi:uncharacterized OsmC-like protein/predicted GNAT family N-acyltransferase